jgi:hypothetical protein
LVVVKREEEEEETKKEEAVMLKCLLLFIIKEVSRYLVANFSMLDCSPPPIDDSLNASRET